METALSILTILVSHRPSVSLRCSAPFGTGRRPPGWTLSSVEDRWRNLFEDGVVIPTSWDKEIDGLSCLLILGWSVRWRKRRRTNVMLAAQQAGLSVRRWWRGYRPRGRPVVALPWRPQQGSAARPRRRRWRSAPQRADKPRPPRSARCSVGMAA